ncbi:hypothetical protein U91I_00776 [alpha proteobacterium U9-1i]|nr:hypothetical protein U91I_00776 [alpha proteobacterium U9-1i]
MWFTCGNRKGNRIWGGRGGIGTFTKRARKPQKIALAQTNQRVGNIAEFARYVTYANWQGY